MTRPPMSACLIESKKYRTGQDIGGQWRTLVAVSSEDPAHKFIFIKRVTIQRCNYIMQLVRAFGNLELLVPLPHKNLTYFWNFL